jgi:hypothetical protein
VLGNDALELITRLRPRGLLAAPVIVRNLYWRALLSILDWLTWNTEATAPPDNSTKGRLAAAETVAISEPDEESAQDAANFGALKG